MKVFVMHHIDCSPIVGVLERTEELRGGIRHMKHQKICAVAIPFGFEGGGDD